MKFPFLLSLILTGAALADAPNRSFAFGEKVTSGVTQILPTMVYAETTGYGFEPGAKVTTHNGSCGGTEAFSFSVKVPPGVYRVEVELGPNTTVKSEQRRLMFHGPMTSTKEGAAGTFIVHVRTKEISATAQVKLKEREKQQETRAWDDRLTLEFCGAAPSVRALSIKPAPELPVLFLMGDSTVCDQPAEPYASWGQMLPLWFSPTIAVANYAQSGDSLKSSLGARRLDKVVSELKPGDFVLVQFGHNDEKDKSPGAGAFTTYADLLRHYAKSIQAKGGQPILVTPVQRRTFDTTGKMTNSHGDFPAAVKSVAAEMKLPLVDLQAISSQLYEAFGKESSGVLFKPGDGTHHNNFGAYELSRCVVTGLQAANLPKLTEHLLPNLVKFDPSHPDDPVDPFVLIVPVSASANAEKPLGN